MSNEQDRPHEAGSRFPTLWIWIAAGLVALGLLAALPGAWARPSQAPDFQTVPTATPSPTSPAAAPTNTPRPPTNTPRPPTNTPVPTATQPPTGTPIPTATSSPGQPQPTAALSPTAPPPALPAPAASPAPSLPEACFVLPTPGFSQVQAVEMSFEAETDYWLVVPGQTVTLRLLVRNTSDGMANDLVICNPLDPDLEVGEPQTSRGTASVQEEGLVVALGSLAPGGRAEVVVSLTVPLDYPLGGVIESQGWLFAAGEEVSSTALVSWALPPAWLPPTGN